MRKRMVWLGIALMMMSSCMNHVSCPTYSSSKGRSATMASTKKSKAAKNNKTPYYKSVKQAEKD